jgi:hypothetical protein
MGQRVSLQEYLEQAEAAQPQRTEKCKSHCRTLGRAPLDWLLTATALRGKVGVVAVWLVFLATVRKTISVRMSYGGLKPYAGRSATYRAIAILERKGLISVARAPGQSPVIQLRFEEPESWKMSAVNRGGERVPNDC